MNVVSPKIVEKIRTLVQIAAELRQGKDFNITRLTPLKSLCSDPEAAAKFALHLAQRTLEKMKSQDCPSHVTPEDWEHYQRLATQAVRGMTEHLKQRTPAGESPLHELLQIIRNAQSEFERQRWGLIRRIHSRDLLTVETALECVLRPIASQLLAYDLARQYAKRYNSRLFHELIPGRARHIRSTVGWETRWTRRRCERRRCPSPKATSRTAWAGRSSAPSSSTFKITWAIGWSYRRLHSHLGFG